MSSTQTSTSKDPVLQQLYDALMAAIEPDLVSMNIASLEEKYQGETEEEAKARGERYEKAFALVDERMKLVLKTWKQELHDFKKQAMATYGQQATQEEAQEISSLEHDIQDA